MHISNERGHNKPFIEDIIWWSLLAIPSSFITGSFIAVLLWTVNGCAALRITYPSLLYYLPAAGLVIFLLNFLFRDQADSFVLGKIHRQDAGVTERSALPVLTGTVLTHLCGGFAGREGAALQIGASISKAFARLCKVKDASFEMVISSGIAAAFSAAFGTPLAGAVFALELARRIHFQATFIPCIISSTIGYLACHLFNVQESQWAYLSHATITPLLKQSPELKTVILLKVSITGVVTGLLCCLFTAFKYGIKRLAGQFPAWAVPVIGGILIILAMHFIPAAGYTPPSIALLFTGQAPSFTWLGILSVTVITLGLRFRGGEITPLLLSAAALGSSLAPLFHVPAPFAAVTALVAVFAGAANTPLAATLLGVELFGGQYIVHFALASLIAYFISPVSNTGLQRAEYWPKLFSKKYMKETSAGTREQNTDSSISNT